MPEAEVMSERDRIPLLKKERTKHGSDTMRLRLMLCYVVILTLAFLPGLITLVRYALASSLHSHIVLVPFVSWYLLHANRSRLPGDFSSSWWWAAVFLCLGIGLLVLAEVWWKEAGNLNDGLAVGGLAYLSLLLAGILAILGCSWVKAAAFSLFFLVFVIPLPDAVAGLLEQHLVASSAVVSEWFLRLVQIPVFRQETVLQLPGITMEVARECSGIRSTWVLLITGLMASYLFLQSPWRRLILVALLIPLGIFRNALRITVIGWLCVHQGPHMIDSRIHHEGGPVFFALSLIPLLLIAWWMRHREIRKVKEERE